MRLLPLLILLSLFVSCKEEKKQLTAQQIIDTAIKNAGGKNYEAATVQFQFRDIQYTSRRANGTFEYSRTFKDSLGETRDVLNNAGFERMVNGTKIIVADSIASKYANAVNSVHYFVQLPFGLNELAVQKQLVGEATIAGKNYYEIKVTFAQEGGGKDHEDVYMYWISKEDFLVDYFAYRYYTDKGGVRFRQAYNARMVNGLRFVDYKNYKVEPWKTVDLATIPSMFEAGKLELVSEIKTENITVERSGVQ